MYKVLAMFTDLQDGGYKYEAGDTYPRKGYEPTEERIAELSSKANKRGQAVIEEIKVEKKAPKKKSTKKK